MDLEEKKKIALEQDIDHLMERMGHQPVKRTKHDTWYLSPFRPGEQKASFHVSRGNQVKSIWKDFGKGTEPSGGNIIHLVRELEGLRFAEAIDYILTYMTRNCLGTKIHSSQKKLPASTKPKQDRHILIKEQDIQNPALFRYLVNQRCLTKPIVQRYLKEVHFQDTQTGKTFFAPGIPNLKNGYEVNNQVNGKKFKSAIPSSSKSMSFLPSDNDNNKVLVFEGFIDALSYLVYEGIAEFPCPVLILNSASMGKEAIEIIKLKGFETIKGYFDNDMRGNILRNLFFRNFPNDFNDKLYLFEGFKDLNDFIIL